VIVLGDPFPDLSSRDSHYRIRIVVIVAGAAENLAPEDTLFEVARLPLQRLLYQVTQETGLAFAVPEYGAGKNSIQLLENCCLISSKG
jgi:hypothetical protein